MLTFSKKQVTLCLFSLAKVQLFDIVNFIFTFFCFLFIVLCNILLGLSPCALTI